MPINIYRVTPEGKDNEEIAWLCDQEWEITPQIEVLKRWLETTAADLPPGEYVADVGFQWRRDAGSGGPVLDPTSMRKMAEKGMYLYLSEYPGFAGEDGQTA